jgi:glycosyltransferase involved in cell wall biosynthesis
MVGTSLDARGGVASVLRTWRDAGLFDRVGVRSVATNLAQGSAIQKAFSAARCWLLCAALIVGRRVSLVHVHTSSYVSFWRKTPIFAIALATATPLVVSLHGGAFREFYAARGPLGQGWIRLVMRRSARFVVLTEEWRRWASTIEPKTRVVVIPNTVADHAAPGNQPPEFASTRAERGPLLFLGRIEPQKGLWILIDALAQAHAQGARWTLVCAGSGDIEGARSHASMQGLGEEAIRFVGWIDDDDKAVWLSTCEALVLPSLIENMPVSILEAYAHRRPVIATRVGGVPDMVTDGVEGLLVDPGQASPLTAALVKAWRENATFKVSGAKARARFERDYACAPVLARVEAMYAQVLATRR